MARPKLTRELTPSRNRSMLLLLNTTRKSSKRDSGDLPEVLQLLRSAVHQRLRSASLRIESKTHSALPALQVMRVLFPGVVLPSSSPAESSTILRVRTSIKMLVSRSSDRHAEFHARPSATTLASRDQLSLTSSLTRTVLPEVSMPPRVSMLTCSRLVSSIPPRSSGLLSLTQQVLLHLCSLLMLW